MWLSDRGNRITPGRTMTGEVTIGGMNTAVYTDTEMRNAVFFAPGGYFWVPGAGQSMIVLKGEGNEVYCMDRQVTSIPENLEEGEVYITSNGNASIRLKNDGTIGINGDIHVTGRVFVNGTEID